MINLFRLWDHIKFLSFLPSQVSPSPTNTSTPSPKSGQDQSAELKAAPQITSSTMMALPGTSTDYGPISRTDTHVITPSHVPLNPTSPTNLVKSTFQKWTNIGSDSTTVLMTSEPTNGPSMVLVGEVKPYSPHHPLKTATLELFLHWEASTTSTMVWAKLVSAPMTQPSIISPTSIKLSSTTWNMPQEPTMLPKTWFKFNVKRTEALVTRCLPRSTFVLMTTTLPWTVIARLLTPDTTTDVQALSSSTLHSVFDFIAANFF